MFAPSSSCIHSSSCGADTKKPDLLKNAFEWKVDSNVINKEKKTAKFNLLIHTKDFRFNTCTSPFLHPTSLNTNSYLYSTSYVCYIEEFEGQAKLKTKWWVITNSGQLPDDSASGSICCTGTTEGSLERYWSQRRFLTRAATKKICVGTSFPKVWPFCEFFCTDLCCPKSVQTDYLDFAQYSKTYSSLENHLLEYQNSH